MSPTAVVLKRARVNTDENILKRIRHQTLLKMVNGKPYSFKMRETIEGTE
jgi:hypothetical protein